MHKKLVKGSMKDYDKDESVKKGMKKKKRANGSLARAAVEKYKE